jgi:hypothetical protein
MEGQPSSKGKAIFLSKNLSRLSNLVNGTNALVGNVFQSLHKRRTKAAQFGFSVEKSVILAMF